MPREVKINSKPIILRDIEAVMLVKNRAVKEGRSSSNSLAQTVIEYFKSKGVVEEVLMRQTEAPANEQMVTSENKQAGIAEKGMVSDVRTHKNNAVKTG